ncbi:RNA-directed DNA polymerase (Reverse transcriptase) [Alkaliphilus metalliredigens QYMF]|uniref:RNA-directed DNA polymerase (Reverse transcriptase) n=1 Tax=Alkaliphilus metalliredigens (strain QYMF) TaxID=293826 RepID=A6TKY0_ALKMQ|nr:group II intron reverse transcriptase/maturase [Alkaliphilus metalliredigens]ABR46848.1 RNA-directed DNA polymerase (Reverse transcriptase) [Alkaliphilus metalliredigens QYMF]
MKKEKPFQITKRAVFEAFKKVEANKGAPGIDEVTLQEYENNLEDNLYKLWNSMSSGSYFPQAVRGVEIPKKNGGVRVLGVPSIDDRIAQNVMVSELNPKVEPIFYEDSYGYRENKSAIDAIEVTRKRCWEYDWLIEFDIVGLFDNINHDLLMKAVKQHTNEKWVILYIERTLKVPMVMSDGIHVERTKGTPQGGVISAVLANLFMHYAFDHWMTRKHSNNPWVRYADDGLIHSHSLKEAEVLLLKLGERFKDCHLEIHPNKTKIIYCKDDNRKQNHIHTNFDFLGYTFRARTVKTKKGNYFTGFTPAVSKIAIKSFMDKIKKLRKNSYLSLTELAEKMNPIIRGWANYFDKFTASKVHAILSCVNLSLARWMMKKSKRYKNKFMAALRRLSSIAEETPSLFVHWKMGICPKN